MADSRQGRGQFRHDPAHRLGLVAKGEEPGSAQVSFRRLGEDDERRAAARGQRQAWAWSIRFRAASVRSAAAMSMSMSSVI